MKHIVLTGVLILCCFCSVHAGSNEPGIDAYELQPISTHPLPAPTSSAELLLKNNEPKHELQPIPTHPLPPVQWKRIVNRASKAVEPKKSEVKTKH